MRLILCAVLEVDWKKIRLIHSTPLFLPFLYFESKGNRPRYSTLKPRGVVVQNKPADEESTDTWHAELPHQPQFVNMLIARRFSLTNFFIATTALGFQVFVLYPWHKRLDDDFQQLRSEAFKVLRDGEKARLKELLEIKEQITALEKKNKGWFSR